jgi:CRP-like cAMP-binding protein
MSEYEQAPTEEDQLRLSALVLFHDIEESARDTLIGSFNVEDAPSGRPLLDEGETNTRLYVILKGSVGVKLPKRDDRVSEVKLATLTAGQIFGEYSLFDGEPVSATVFATEPSRIAWLEKMALDAFVDGHREAGRRLYENISRMLIRRLRDKNAEMDLVTIG